MQYDSLGAGAAGRLEMSLWSHGDDREVYRAQHLFCHRAEEQLAYLAPAPSPKNETICFELTSRRDDLLSGVAFANDGITGNLLRAGHRSERLDPPGVEISCFD